MIPTAEILGIGEELLIGKIANTNAQFLSKRITSLGGRVTRHLVVGDDLAAIATAVNECLARRPSFLITTGGLGPTFDDKTLEGIAEALGRPLALHPEAFRMVREKYETLSRQRGQAIELTPARVKMAKLPEGSTPLRNPVGTAPGVLIEVGDVTMIALPGVPSEMEAIFEESVASMVKNRSDATFYEENWRLDGVYESELAPLIDQAMHTAPFVYVKSHPRREEGRSHIELHLSTSAPTLEEGKARVQKCIGALMQLIAKSGGKLSPMIG
ncbi:MAG: molybdopterin-binding protein [Candidatus Bathyarchaeia archaeon]